MTLDANDAFKARKNKEENRPIFLYTIHDYDGAGNDLTYTSWAEDVTYDSVTYTRFPIKHQFLGENVEGEIGGVEVMVGNADRTISSYLEDYDLRGKKVTITMVFKADLDDADANIGAVYYIDSYGANETTVTFKLTSVMDVLNIELPLGSFNRNHCRWDFKSTECGYSDAETSCNKTFQRCKELNNSARFGGFPSIPEDNIITV